MGETKQAPSAAIVRKHTGKPHFSLVYDGKYLNMKCMSRIFLAATVVVYNATAEFPKVEPGRTIIALVFTLYVLRLHGRVKINDSFNNFRIPEVVLGWLTVYLFENGETCKSATGLNVCLLLYLLVQTVPRPVLLSWIISTR